MTYYLLVYNPNMEKRTNEEWLADLRAGGDRQAQALEDLRAIILRGLPYAIAGRLDPNSPASEALVEEVIQETLMRVLEYLDTFEGRSQFTTWAHKIAVRAALTELRRVRWREVPLPEMEINDETDASYRELPDRQASPEEQMSRTEMMERVNQSHHGRTDRKTTPGIIGNYGRIPVGRSCSANWNELQCAL